MRKAINTGILTGFILSIILMLGTMCRMFLPGHTTIANLTFTIIFISVIVIALWVAMGSYSRSVSPSWSNLAFISIITTITTSVLFSTLSFIYSRFFSSRLLSYVAEQSKPNWLEPGYSAQSIAAQGELTWYKIPWNFAFNNLQVMLVVLFVISLFIAFVYYSKNRNKIPQHESHNNHELIF